MQRTTINDMATYQTTLRRAITGHDTFPTDERERVKYSMAIISHELACRHNRRSPYEYSPIKLHLFTSDMVEMRYLWTAAMVFGMRLKTMKFNQNSIRCSEKDTEHGDSRKRESDFKRLRERYFTGGYFWPTDPFDYSDQLGWISRFSSESLYETIFKNHITDDMLVIPKSSLISNDFLNKSSHQEWEKERREKIKLCHSRGEAKSISLITLYSKNRNYINDFNSIKKFSGGYNLPHDGYLMLAKILVDDAIYYDKDDSTKLYIHGTGTVTRDNVHLLEAIALYCWHADVVFITEGFDLDKNMEKKLEISDKKLKNYFERIEICEMGSKMFSDDEMSKFKELVTPFHDRQRKICESAIAKKTLSDRQNKKEVRTNSSAATNIEAEKNITSYADILPPINTLDDARQRSEMQREAARLTAAARAKTAREKRTGTSTSPHTRIDEQKPRQEMPIRRDQSSVKQQPHHNNTLFNQPIMPPSAEAKRLDAERLKQQEYHRNRESARVIKLQEQKRLQEIELERVRAIERAKQEEKDLKARIEKYQDLMGL